MVFEVTGNGVVKVYAVSALHVVPVAWIGEEVGVSIGINAGTHEGEGVLRYAYGVVSSIDDEETAFEVLSLIE